MEALAETKKNNKKIWHSEKVKELTLSESYAAFMDKCMGSQIRITAMGWKSIKIQLDQS